MTEIKILLKLDQICKEREQRLHLVQKELWWGTCAEQNAALLEFSDFLPGM